METGANICGFYLLFNSFLFLNFSFKLLSTTICRFVARNSGHVGHVSCFIYRGRPSKSYSDQHGDQDVSHLKSKSPPRCLGHAGCLQPPDIDRSLGTREMDVSENSGTPKSSILIGFSIINHPFWGTHYFWKHPNDHNI